MKKLVVKKTSSFCSSDEYCDSLKTPIRISKEDKNSDLNCSSSVSMAIAE